MLINSAPFSYFEHARTMVAMISDLPGNPSINQLMEDINENQVGFRMKSAKTGRIETFVYIDTLHHHCDHEGPELQGWTFRPKSHSLQSHINLVTIYND